MVQPLPANPFMAEVEVRTGDSFVPGRYRAFGSPTVELFPEDAVALLEAPPGLPATEVARIVADAEDVPDAHYWLEWSRYPYVRLTRHADGWEVAFRDARYDGQEGTGGLSGVTVVVQP